jgi:hypothetical protein
MITNPLFFEDIEKRGALILLCSRIESETFREFVLYSRTSEVCQQSEGGCKPPFPFAWTRRDGLALDDIDDLVGVRTKNDVPAMHQDEIVAAPLRIDFNDAGRHRMIAEAGRDGRAD